MYCVKCGKQIDYDAKLCKECESKETNEAQTIIEAKVFSDNQAQNVIISPAVAPKEKAESKNKRAHNEGLGLALASVIMIPFVLIMYSVYYSELYYCLEEIFYHGNSQLIGDLVISIVNVVAVIVACIAGLVMTIKTFKVQGEIIKNGGVRHTATFVLATIGRVLSILALVIVGETLLSLIKLIF